MTNDFKKKTLSFRLDSELYKKLKFISLENDITIQDMGETFILLYKVKQISFFKKEILKTNQRKLYRDANESTVNFKIDTKSHTELRDELEKKQLTFQQIAEKFFKYLVENKLKIDISNTEYDKLSRKHQYAIKVFENPH